MKTTGIKVMLFFSTVLLLAGFMALNVLAAQTSVTVTPNDPKAGWVKVVIENAELKNKDVSLVCFIPGRSGTDISVNQQKVSYLDQIQLNAQGKYEGSFQLKSAAVKGDYAVVVGSSKDDNPVVKSFKMLSDEPPVDPAVEDVIKKINAIGTVQYTTASKNLIDAAKKAYDALSAAQKAKVTNYSKLTAAVSKYAELEKQYIEENTPPAKGKPVKDPSGNLKYTVVKRASAKAKGTVQVVGLAKASLKKVNIPAEIKGGKFTYKVVGIKKNAFKGKKKITSVKIGSNVTAIGANAFSGCTKLQDVTIGKAVKTIGKSAFDKDKKLKTVIFKGAAVSKINSKAFNGIKKTAAFKLPNNKKAKANYKKWLLKAGAKKSMKFR